MYKPLLYHFETVIASLECPKSSIALWRVTPNAMHLRRDRHMSMDAHLSSVRTPRTQRRAVDVEYHRDC
jgi:hypothetical protein